MTYEEMMRSKFPEYYNNPLREFGDSLLVYKNPLMEYYEEKYAIFRGKRIKCSKCGAIIDFEDCHILENKEYMGDDIRTISSGFPAGVTVKQVNRKYRTWDTFLCYNCFLIATKYKKRHKFWMILLYVFIFSVFGLITYLAINGYIGEKVLLVAIIPFAYFLYYLFGKLHEMIS